MNNFHHNDLYHDAASSSRSPRASHPHQAHAHSHRDNNVRPYDGYLNQPYAMDDVQSRFDGPRYPDQMNQTMRGGYGNGYDMGMPSAWNSSNYAHNNTLAALGATTRGKQNQRNSRPALPSMWLEQPQPIQPNSFSNFGNPNMNPYQSQMRHDHMGASDTDEDLIPTAIVIKNIPFAVKKEQLVSVMTDMSLPLPYAFNYHFDNGVFRGLAFANFTSAEETAAVIAAMNHLDLHGRKLRVEYKKMLPQIERDRIEREKRERRGQLEEQHRPIGQSQLSQQPSMSSMTSSHIPATSPSPNSSRNNQPGIDMNDPITLGYYSRLLLFQGDANAGEMFAFSSEIPATHRKLIHGLAHQLGLGHTSHGTGDSRQVHIYRNPNGMSPPLPSNGHPLDPSRRQLNRSATTDFSNVRAQDANFYGGLGNQSAGFLGFPDTQGGLSVGSNLRAAKSFADLRSYTPSPAQSASSFPAGLTGNISRFQEYGPSSPGSSRSNITPTTATMPENILTGMGSMNLGSGGFGQPTSGSPHRLRGMMSWDREGPGPIGGHRTFSAQQDDANRNRSQGAPIRQPRGPVPERGPGFQRGRQNGHQPRGSDDISASGVEIVVE